MDDVTLVRQFRAEVPEPDGATLDRIRDDVVAALPARDARRPGRMRLLAAFRNRRPAVRLAIAAGVVAVIALSTIVVDALVPPNGRPVIGHEAAAAAFYQAAAVAIRASDPPLKPGQFYYRRTVEVAGAGFADGPCGGLFYLQKSVYETWIPKDWSDQWMRRQADEVERYFFRPSDEAKAKQCGARPPFPGIEVRKAPAGLFYPEGAFRLGDEPRDASGAIVYNPSPAEIARRLAQGNWQGPTPPFMAGLPRDPKRLLDRIYHDSKGQGRGRDEEAFVFVRDILRSGVVPADLRAALFSAAALIPGVRLVSDSVNLEGRHGVAVAMSDHGETRVELIFDPASGEVIGEREVVLVADYVGGVRPGTTIGYTAVSRQVVDAMGAMPGK